MTIDQLIEELTHYRNLGLPVVANLGQDGEYSGGKPIGDVSPYWAYRYRSTPGCVPNRWQYNGCLESGPIIFYEDDEDVEISVVVSIDGVYP